MFFDFSAVLVFLLIGVAFIYGTLLVGALVRPKHPTEEKNLIYECGEPTIGSSWIRYNIRFYTIALVYLIFDVEVVFLFPAVLLVRELQLLALIEILTFVAILALGLVYAWRFGNLDWISVGPEDEAEGEETEVQEIGMGV